MLLWRLTLNGARVDLLRHCGAEAFLRSSQPADVDGPKIEKDSCCKIERSR